MKKNEKTAMTEAARVPLFDLAGKGIYVAGHTGMVGAALVRRLRSECCTILTIDHATLSYLTRQAETERWIGIGQLRPVSGNYSKVASLNADVWSLM